MSEEPEGGTPGRTALYRICGEADLLLYIGITNRVPIRWNGHQAVQPWWDEVRLIMVEWYGTRAAAAAAEKAAILAEQPKYNVTYLRPTLGRPGGNRSESEAVDWESFALEAQDDDEDLLNLEDVGRMIRCSVPSTVKATLRRAGGPQGFMLGSLLLFRKGEIRRWIAAAEAAQKPPEAVIAYKRSLRAGQPGDPSRDASTHGCAV